MSSVLATNLNGLFVTSLFRAKYVVGNLSHQEMKDAHRFFARFLSKHAFVQNSYKMNSSATVHTQ